MEELFSKMTNIEEHSRRPARYFQKRLGGKTTASNLCDEKIKARASDFQQLGTKLYWRMTTAL